MSMHDLYQNRLSFPGRQKWSGKLLINLKNSCLSTNLFRITSFEHSSVFRIFWPIDVIIMILLNIQSTQETIRNTPQRNSIHRISVFQLFRFLLSTKNIQVFFSLSKFIFPLSPIWMRRGCLKKSYHLFKGTEGKTFSTSEITSQLKLFE